MRASVPTPMGGLTTRRELLGLGALALGAVACGGSTGGGGGSTPASSSLANKKIEGKLQFYNWGEYVDPNDGVSFLPPELRTAGRVDTVAFEQGLVILSTMPTRDGYAGDQSLFAPAFTASDAELAEMVERFAAAVRQVADEVSGRLKKPAAVS